MLLKDQIKELGNEIERLKRVIANLEDDIKIYEKEYEVKD